MDPVRNVSDAFRKYEEKPTDRTRLKPLEHLILFYMPVIHRFQLQIVENIEQRLRKNGLEEDHPLLKKIQEAIKKITVFNETQKKADASVEFAGGEQSEVALERSQSPRKDKKVFERNRERRRSETPRSLPYPV